MNKLQIFIRGFMANSFLKNMQLFLSGKFTLAATTLAIGVITARLLSPENRGLYTLFFTLSGLLVTFLHVGLSPANIYFLNVKKVKIGELIGNTFAYVFLSMCLLGSLFIVFVACDFRGPFLGFQAGMIWFLIWLTILYSLLETSISGLILATNLYTFLNRSLIYQSIILLSSALLIPVVGSQLEWAIGLRVFGISLFIVWFLFIFLKLANFRQLSVSPLILKEQIEFGRKNWAQNVIGFLNVRSYILILGFFADPETVGFFSVAWLFVEILRFLPDTIGAMILPELTNNKSKPQQISLTVRSLRLIFSLVLILSISIFLVADIVIPLIFGSAYLPSIDIAKFLMVGATLGAVYQVLTRYFTSQAQQKYSIISGLWGLAVGLIGCIALIPAHGGSGAAFAFAASALITAVWVLYYFCHSTNTSLWRVVNISRKDFAF